MESVYKSNSVPSDNVVLFPQKKPSVSEDLTAEQELKYFMLEMAVPVITGLEDRLIRDGKAVDELFTMVADQLFGAK
ncbi:hypothetical protein IAQ67_29290 (plasmid) [Paenibacillus peoriae]|uniref:Uncharacterized protein n=1 Tax=Paenibacillus peoriae TaxID=59893 RepID=A0A7H0YHJ7_9BACL|nr:hypothetical protein [Paenibacillus peoriae]QNR70555.1 hypothetical protein IAQ67_29290 [Paenibacillus peoriae]